MQQEALLWQRDRTTRLSVEILQLQNILKTIESRAYRSRRDPTFSHFHTIPECNTHTHTYTDKQTDGQTHDDGMYSIALRGKNRPYCTAHQVQLPGNERRLIAKF